MSAIIEEALREIFDNEVLREMFDNPDPRKVNDKLWKYYADILTNAVEEGYIDIDFEELPEARANKFSLKNNIALFAGLKAYHEQSDMAKVMKNEDGTLRKFSEFRKDALKINEKYRKQWLRTEYDSTLRSSAMAAKWQDVWSKREALPYLEYVASRSAEPREAHMKYYGKIYRVDDPIWATILPQNGWGCKCSVRQLRSLNASQQLSTGGDDIEPAFRNNAGITGKIFSDFHPYASGVDPEAKKYIKENAKRYT